MVLKVADIIASRGRITAWCPQCKPMYVLADPWLCLRVAIDADVLDIQRSLKCTGRAQQTDGQRDDISATCWAAMLAMMSCMVKLLG
ncbi:hypothetical protein [Falsirhodobacter sp. 1013]|uniref:hypothetical protein n=1 Tax=Falsirhodobacter sp. 1013 TaxID=3417566 RepID=UPI003EC1410B